MNQNVDLFYIAPLIACPHCRL